jgi:hypothetical protein
MSQGTCKECRFWKVDWDVDLNRCHPSYGGCRINPPGANGFPRAVSSDWCGKFEPLSAEHKDHDASSLFDLLEKVAPWIPVCKPGLHEEVQAALDAGVNGAGVQSAGEGEQ